jgi:hypothetical protein
VNKLLVSQAEWQCRNVPRLQPPKMERAITSDAPKFVLLYYPKIVNKSTGC